MSGHSQVKPNENESNTTPSDIKLLTVSETTRTYLDEEVLNQSQNEEAQKPKKCSMRALFSLFFQVNAKNKYCIIINKKK